MPSPHFFKYNLFHLLLDADALDAGVTGTSSSSSLLFNYYPATGVAVPGYLSAAVVQIREDDYLAPVPGSGGRKTGMRARVEHVVETIGVGKQARGKQDG